MYLRKMKIEDYDNVYSLWMSCVGISNKKDDIEELSYIINSVDGNEPPVEAKKLIHLYSLGYIDYETAKFCIIRLFTNDR